MVCFHNMASPMLKELLVVLVVVDISELNLGDNIFVLWAGLVKQSNKFVSDLNVREDIFILWVGDRDGSSGGGFMVDVEGEGLISKEQEED